MKKTRSLLAGLVLLAVLPCTFTSCATTHLMRWSFGESSILREHDTDLGNAILKPSLTVLYLPLASAWDVVTLPFQVIWGIYPWGGRMLQPAGQDSE